VVNSAPQTHKRELYCSYLGNSSLVRIDSAALKINAHIAMREAATVFA